jgi:hypothetical protein
LLVVTAPSTPIGCSAVTGSLLSQPLSLMNTATALFVVVQVDALDQVGDFLGAHLLMSKI